MGKNRKITKAIIREQQAKAGSFKISDGTIAVEHLNAKDKITTQVVDRKEVVLLRRGGNSKGSRYAATLAKAEQLAAGKVLLVDPPTKGRASAMNLRNYLGGLTRKRPAVKGKKLLFAVTTTDQVAIRLEKA